MAHFSDIDTSEDERSRKRSSTAPKPKGQGRMRTKECPGCKAMLAVSTKECLYCDYQFTSRSMLQNQYSATEESSFIRDRFPFEPERVSTPHDALLFQLLYFISIGGRRESYNPINFRKTSTEISASMVSARYYDIYV